MQNTVNCYGSFEGGGGFIGSILKENIMFRTENRTHKYFQSSAKNEEISVKWRFALTPYIHWFYKNPTPPLFQTVCSVCHQEEHAVQNIQ